MSLEITFEMLSAHSRDRLSQPTWKSAILESDMTADSIQIMILTTNLMLFDRKGGYSECENGTHYMEHNCAGLSFPLLSSSRRQNTKNLNGSAA